MKIRNHELTGTDIVASIIFGVAGISAFILILELAQLKSIPGTFFIDVTNACINTSSFFLAAIFAIYAIIVTLNKTFPGEFLYLTIVPIAAIITGIFTIIFSYFPATAPLAIAFLGVSLELTILTLSIIYFLINVTIPLNRTRNKPLPINQPATNKKE
ncbi:MAG: hypothetical protein ACYDDV_11010 [Methanoregula sp.]